MGDIIAAGKYAKATNKENRENSKLQKNTHKFPEIANWICQGSDCEHL